MLIFFLLILIGCNSAQPLELANRLPTHSPTPSQSIPAKPAKVKDYKTIHVIVALCDKKYQGIVPVPARIGNGDDPANNLYWGAAYGVKSFFKKSNEWTLVTNHENPKFPILERLIFKHKTQAVYLIADAYQGKEIKQSIIDFFDFSAGKKTEVLKAIVNAKSYSIDIGGNADLIAYVGHDGLMDFSLEKFSAKTDEAKRETIMLACISKQFFAEPLKASGARPLLWTTGLMAPEAYVLKAAIDGWLARESDTQIRSRAAEAYNKYQKCGIRAATKLFATGW